MLLLTTLLLSLVSLIAAQSSNSSVFVYNGGDDTSFTFALQAVKSTGDLYFHMSGPSGNSWLAVGLGYKMEGALMLITYANSNNDGVTISPRYATGETEPVYQSNVTVDAMSTDPVSGYLTANGVCRGCVTWLNGGGIDLTSAAQPFIFAIGPPFPPLQSDSGSAGLTEHAFVGHFTMDMPAATVQSNGNVPQGPFTSSQSASTATNTETTYNPAPHIHGLVMGFVFIIILPLGSLILRVWNSVRYHIVAQCIGLVLFLMAVAGGCVASTMYNRSKNFNSAHQIIGLLVMVAFLTQLVLGVMHHRIYKREQRKTMRGWIHLYLGPTIILIGLVNGILGFNLAGETFVAIPYCILIVIVGVIYSCIRFFSWRRKRRAAKDPGATMGQSMPYGNVRPPAYREDSYRSAGEPFSSQDVPLAPYASTHSVAQVGMPAHEPRSMF
ncbi:hypothetical protein BDY17DRAFT_301142 [Neohortaea acidophila]|uniref:DOMON domain-containing protein n=1 Tax=Neohortaea acidophila TaxID=245834 RepID=A0A6A6PML8_9PEZI|nr:uncharacterized protein BDY17DRAFT_301142 [Neohortaea acidophila]KAF2481330.1 hypothetical protein BDY17DRAFT_301142 [Neohortaea acidophila]